MSGSVPTSQNKIKIGVALRAAQLRPCSVRPAIGVPHFGMHYLPAVSMQRAGCSYSLSVGSLTRKARTCAACLALAAAQEPPTSPTEKPKPKPKPKAKSTECSFKGNAWKDSLTDSEKLLGGAFARLCSQTLLHPLDTIRTRRQAKGGLETTWKDCTKGLVPQMAGAMPAGALQFTAYERSKSGLTKLFANYTMGGLKPHVIEICSASIGACAASLVRVPQERVKQPVQADMYPNWVAAVNGNLEKGGVGAFFVGMKATVMRDVPWNALSFLFFNAFKMVYEGLQNKAPNQRDTMALGAIAGGLGAVIMTPVDVVKTRLMLQVRVGVVGCVR